MNWKIYYFLCRKSISFPRPIWRIRHQFSLTKFQLLLWPLAYVVLIKHFDFGWLSHQHILSLTSSLDIVGVDTPKENFDCRFAMSTWMSTLLFGQIWETGLKGRGGLGSKFRGCRGCCCVLMPGCCLRVSKLLCVCVVLSLSPEWKNWERPGNMRPCGRAPSPCDDITLQTPLFSVFPFESETFYNRRKKNENEMLIHWEHCNYSY